MSGPTLALTQGDPAGIGPELLLRLLAGPDLERAWKPLLFAERAALERAAEGLEGAGAVLERCRFVASAPSGPSTGEEVVVVDPVGRARPMEPGNSREEDARGALAALDAAVAAVRTGSAEGLVTLPVSKASIARHCRPEFRGHTEYLAAACGLERYGRDYLMAFLAPRLRVALLTTHLPLRRALDAVTEQSVLEAVLCLHRHRGGRIAVAGLNPHAGEEGLLGDEDRQIVAPAIERARAEGVDVSGPEPPDTVFSRARRGLFDWVLALYHDQGLVAVKTLAFGEAVNWTLGLPFVRTSVDHGTAFDIAGRGRADVAPLRRVVEVTVDLVSGSR
ncbi:MAG: 4-hydroxythreonine-4-phosphate dehydrogenase PdxA [Thermoanaerobaculia bacterium]